MNQQKIHNIFRCLDESHPDPETELNFKNEFTLLVAVVLSAQSTDAGVNKATKQLFKTVDTPQKMLDLGEDGVKEHIKTIGLYNNKAKYVIGLSEKLIDEFDGQVPDNRSDLMSLPGVGRKTANVVLNVAYGQTTMPVDTHVFRVANRIGMSDGDTPRQVEKDLMKILPDKYGVKAHHLLILHGRYTCKARKPLCPECSIQDYCAFGNKTSQEELS